MGSSPHTRGTLSPLNARAVGLQDHPRIRGEHLPDIDKLRPLIGIIPAYAGNTGASRTRQATAPGSSPHTRGTRPWRRLGSGLRGDHPRIRGEHSCSSRAGRWPDGIIPAYAGNTIHMMLHAHQRPGSSPHTRGTLLVSARQVGHEGDHPRIRGEHHVGRGAGDMEDGIIPAYAGNTGTDQCCPSLRSGSSPHTRGTP